MHFLKRLWGTRSNQPATDDSTVQFESPLKSAFRLAREQRNIDLILPVFLQSRLLVVAGSPGLPGDLNDLFLLPAPVGNGRMTVTVSEREEWLSTVTWPKRTTSGEELLNKLPPGMEITVVYRDGGDYITREQREWYQQLALRSEPS